MIQRVLNDKEEQGKRCCGLEDFNTTDKQTNSLTSNLPSKKGTSVSIFHIQAGLSLG